MTFNTHRRTLSRAIFQPIFLLQSGTSLFFSAFMIILLELDKES